MNIQSVVLKSAIMQFKRVANVYLVVLYFIVLFEVIIMLMINLIYWNVEEKKFFEVISIFF
jgi:hypothetical protein